MAVWGSPEDRIHPRVPQGWAAEVGGGTSGTQAASNSPAFKNPAAAPCSHSALPYIPDPMSPPLPSPLGPLGLWGGWGSGWGSGWGWGWGDVLDFRVEPHQLSALSSGGGFWVSAAPEPAVESPPSTPGLLSMLTPHVGLGGSSLEAGAVREEGRRSGRGKEGRAQTSSKFTSGL